MFPTNKKPDEMTEKELLLYLVKEVDEVKRYTANTHVNTDSEIDEIRTIVRKIETQLNETDRQVDRIERFEREISDVKSTLRQIERKLR